MKIALLAHSLFPIIAPYASKLEEHTHLLCKSLQSIGHEVDLYAHPKSDSSFIKKPKVFSYQGEEGYDIGPEKTGKIDSTLWYPNLFLQINTGSYDIVHNQYFQNQPAPLEPYEHSAIITTLYNRERLHYENFNSQVSKKLFCDLILISTRIGSRWNHHYKVIYNTLGPEHMVKEYISIYKELMEFRFNE